MNFLRVLTFLLMMVPIAVSLYRIWEPTLVHIALVGVIAGGGFMGVRVGEGTWWLIFPQTALVVPVTVWAFRKKRALRADEKDTTAASGDASDSA